MNDKTKIVLYVIVGLVVLGLLLVTFFPGMIYAARDSGKSGSAICDPQPGYTEAEWREHMGHHPNIYKDCL